MKKAKVKARVDQAKAQTQAKFEAMVRPILEKAITNAQAQAREEEIRKEQKRLREDIVKIVQFRFPDLTALAQETLQQIDSSDTLHFLLLHLVRAANETATRYILYPSAA